MPVDERERLSEAYLAAWNVHDPAAVAAFFAAEATYDDRGAGRLLRGRPQIEAYVREVMAAFPDLRFQIVRSGLGEDFMMSEWRAEMTHRGELEGLAATGRRITSAGVDVATFDDENGLVTHLVSYYDGAEIMRALGLLPGRHSRAERLLLRLASLRPTRS
jgi:steroid delta-isomerase-like uncharacterized protein